MAVSREDSWDHNVSQSAENPSEMLRAKLETVLDLKKEMTEEVNCLLEKIKLDMDSALEDDASASTETVQTLHSRLEAASEILKKKSLDIQDATLSKTIYRPGLLREKSVSCGNVACSHQSSYSLQYRLEVLEEQVEMLHQTPHKSCAADHQNMEDTLAKICGKVEGLSKSQTELEKKLRLKMTAIENTAQQRYETMEQKSDAAQNEMVKLKVKLINTEQKQMANLKDVSGIKSSVAQMEEQTLNLKAQMSEVMDRLARMEANIVKVNERSSSEDKVVQLEKELATLKSQMTEVIDKVSEIKAEAVQADKSCKEEHKKQNTVLDKLKEEFSQSRKTFVSHVQNLRSQADSLRKCSQKTEADLKKLTEENEDFKENVEDMQATLEGKFEDLVSRKLEDLKGQVENMREKTEENTYDMQQCWERISELETQARSMLADVEELKYVQIDGEKIKIDSEVGKLNFGVDALTVQMEDMNRQIGELQRDLISNKNAWNLLDIGWHGDYSETALIAAIKQVGLKFELMKEIVVKRVDRLEILRRNLALLDKTVTKRQELAKEVQSLKAAVKVLQSKCPAKGFVFTKPAQEGKGKACVSAGFSFGTVTPSSGSKGISAPSSGGGFSFGVGSKPSSASTDMSISPALSSGSKPATSDTRSSYKPATTGTNSASTVLSGIKPVTSVTNSASTGLFGSKLVTSDTNSVSTGMFGSKPVTSVTNSASTGLFGSKLVTSDTNSASPGLFGSSSVTPTSSSLHGSSLPASSASSSLFGSSPALTPASSSLHGNSQPVFGASALLFGNSPTLTPASSSLHGNSQPVFRASTSLFGSSPTVTPASSSLHGNSHLVFGASTSLFASSPVVPAVSSSPLGSSLAVSSASSSIFGSSPAVIPATST